MARTVTADMFKFRT